MVLKGLVKIVSVTKKNPEDANWNICWNTAKPSTFYTQYSWKPKSYIKL
jgi:hypothetical protein